MNNLKSDSGEASRNFTYRITDNDRLNIEIEHGSLGEFFNKVVKKELKRLKNKRVKPNSKLK